MLSLLQTGSEAPAGRLGGQEAAPEASGNTLDVRRRDPIQRALWNPRLSPGLLAAPESDLQLWPVGAGEEGAVLCGSDLSSAAFWLCGLGQGTAAPYPHCLSFPTCKMGITVLPIC